MSLFIGSLAYDEPEYYQGAALGVLLASVLSAMIGYAWLALCLPKVRK
jgi:NhaA family Na+:H+ antiporter